MSQRWDSDKDTLGAVQMQRTQRIAVKPARGLVNDSHDQEMKL